MKFVNDNTINRTMNSYITPLLSVFEQHRNDEEAIAMSAYMKNRFPFYGIKATPRREMMKAFLSENPLPGWEKLEDVALELWECEERECQMVAVDLLLKRIKKAPATAIEVLEKLIISKSWWDSVDAIASNLVGTLFQRHPELTRPTVDRWMASNNLWLQRTCILFQLKYRLNTDTALLFECILQVADSKEFFLQKAIGWALREYSKRNPAVVEEFVANHQLASLSQKEALRLIKK